MRNLLNQMLKQPTQNQYQGGLSQPNQPITNTDEPWVLNSDIFYLLNTIKIYAETSTGKLTLEVVDKNDIGTSVQKIAHLLTDSEHNNTPIMLTVCGATWETRAQSRRARAIPKAAGLRFYLNQRIANDAYFYKGDAVRFDEVPSDLFSDRMLKDSHSIANLCPNAFICLLEENNARIAQPIFMRAGNFTEPLSHHESQALARLTPKGLANLGTP